MTPQTLEANHEVEQKALTVIEKANGITVKTAQDYKQASGFLVTIKGMQKEVKETFDPIVDKAYAAHKEAVLQRDKFLKPLTQAEGALKSRMVTFQDAEEERVRKEQEAARVAAEEKARKEREALEAKADKAAAKGNIEKAQSYQEQAQAVAPEVPIVAPQAPKIEGQAVKRAWKGEVTDVMALIKAIAAGQAPMSLVEVDQGAVNRYAASVKGTLKLPGVRFYEEKSISQRA